MLCDGGLVSYRSLTQVDRYLHGAGIFVRDVLKHFDLPQVAEMFTHLGFPDYFRVELSWAKILGVALLLAPVPARLKEWAYAGFAFTLASALIAHFSVGDGPEVWSWSAGTGVLWGLSYFFWRRVQATAVNA